jgi:predicted HTH domain antitoxin
MTVTFNLPCEAARSFHEAWGESLDQKAFEALVIQGYREKRFSVGRVAELVGLGTSIQAEQWLADRRVERNLDASDASDVYSAWNRLHTLSPRSI